MSIDESMYRHTVAQRDAAWREVEHWRTKYDALTKLMAEHMMAMTHPPMQMLADKESYEAGRIKGREEGAAAEREACCKAIDEIDDGEAPEYRACQEAIRARGQA